MGKKQRNNRNLNDRSSLSPMFFKIGALKTYANFTGKRRNGVSSE